MRPRLLFVPLVLLIAAFLVAACDEPTARVKTHSFRSPTPSPTVTLPVPTSTPTPLPPPPPTISLDTKVVEGQLAEVLRDTTKLRGLEPKSDVPEYFVSGAEMKYKRTLATIEEYTAEMARRDVTALWLLLFVNDRSLDFRKMEIEFAGTSLLGYYDPDKKEMFVRTDNPTLDPQSRETLAHEYVHSLQDQHFNLQDLLGPHVENDQSMAVRALVEGDATISGLMYAARYMNSRDYAKLFEYTGEVAPPVPGRAPIYLQRAWQFPYTYGSNFVGELSALKGYDAVDKAFADPPKSSEQIMHPEKYLDTPRDEPMTVHMPAMTDTLGLLGGGWRFTRTDTLGEFDFDILLLENYVDAYEASVGWGGARYNLYEHENGKDALVIMASKWDTPRDLQEFEKAFTGSFKLFQKRNDLWLDHGRAWSLKRLGDTLYFVSGTDATAVRNILASLK